MSQSQFLKVALEAAQKAEEVILKYYSDSIAVELKADQTPVTVADQEAEHVIIDTIKQQFPEHGFLGEESGVVDTESGYQWIIDPIDGTKNYIRKIPLFATQIALMKDGELIVGVSNSPIMKECLYAERGKGAYMDVGGRARSRYGERIHVSEVSDCSEAMVCHGGLDTFDQDELLPNMCRLIRDTSRSRGFGDYYIFHLLASGRADIAIEAADLEPWDISALAVIVEEAGGTITDMGGGPLDQHSTPVIATNGVLHDTVLKYFREIP